MTQLQKDIGSRQGQESRTIRYPLRMQGPVSVYDRVALGLVEPDLEKIQANMEKRLKKIFAPFDEVPRTPGALADRPAPDKMRGTATDHDNSCPRPNKPSIFSISDV